MLFLKLWKQEYFVGKSLCSHGITEEMLLNRKTKQIFQTISFRCSDFFLPKSSVFIILLIL